MDVPALAVAVAPFAMLDFFQHFCRSFDGVNYEAISKLDITAEVAKVPDKPDPTLK